MLKPSVALTVGNKLYDQQTFAFRLRRTMLPALDRLEVRFPKGVQFDEAPGADCSIDIDGGEGAKTVFTGKLAEVKRTYLAVELTAYNGGMQLARYRPATSFEKTTAGDVIDALCADAGVTVGERVDGPGLALLALDGRATAAEQIARLALDAGAIGAFDGDDRLFVTEDGGPGGEFALRYGRELLHVESSAILSDYPAITVTGDGGGAPTSAESQWVIADFHAGNAPSPGPSERIVSRPEIRTTDDARAAAGALTQRRSAALSPVRLTLWLNPNIEPGMRLELSDMPDDLPLAECRVSQLISRWEPGGAMITDVWATGNVAGAASFLDAPGGLL